mmetsp:Transcript_18384/g.62557  ORF Transcript_18384/g.62557 Transcript_18384/m.62557 type:complete len:361 (+) Transcript_18384:1380-2462(+)
MREAHAAASLVNEVNRLVGEEAVADVLVRQLRGRLERLVRVLELVVELVALPKPLEDLGRLLHGGLRHLHRLEAALQRGVLLDVLAVLVQRRGADALQLAAGQRGLEDVGSVNGALGGAGANERVHLVDEEDDVLVLLHLVHELLEALLELAAVLGARHEQAHVERHHPLVLDGLRHVAGGDLLRQPLSDGALAHARLADEARVVLRAPAEDLDGALDLRAAPHARVQLALLRLLRHVRAELLQRRGLGVAARRAARAGARPDGLVVLANHADHLRADLGRVRVQVLQHAGGDALALAEEAEEEVLGADVVVAQLAGLLERELEHALGAGREGDLHSDEPRAAADDLLDLDARLLQVDAH